MFASTCTLIVIYNNDRTPCARRDPNTRLNETLADDLARIIPRGLSSRPMKNERRIGRVAKLITSQNLLVTRDSRLIRFSLLRQESPFGREMKIGNS